MDDNTNNNLKTIDESFLTSAGLSISDDSQKANVISKIQAELEDRIGERVYKDLSEDKLTAFEQFIKDNQPAQAVEWLKSNVPSYQSIADEEFESLKTDVRADSSKYL